MERLIYQFSGVKVALQVKMCPQFLCKCCMQHFVLCITMSGYLQNAYGEDTWLLNCLTWKKQLTSCAGPSFHDDPLYSPLLPRHMCSFLLVAFSITEKWQTILRRRECQCQEHKVEATSLQESTLGHAARAGWERSKKGVTKKSSVCFRIVIEQSQARPCGDERGTVPCFLLVHIIMWNPLLNQRTVG